MKVVDSYNNGSNLRHRGCTMVWEKCGRRGVGVRKPVNRFNAFDRFSHITYSTLYPNLIKTVANFLIITLSSCWTCVVFVVVSCDDNNLS